MTKRQQQLADAARGLSASRVAIILRRFDRGVDYQKVPKGYIFETLSERISVEWIWEDLLKALRNEPRKKRGPTKREVERQARLKEAEGWTVKTAQARLVEVEEALSPMQALDHERRKLLRILGTLDPLWMDR